MGPSLAIGGQHALTPVAHDGLPMAWPVIRRLLHRIHEHDHAIGLHPGYMTDQHPDQTQRETGTLRRTLDDEGISCADLGGRQHPVGARFIGRMRRMSGSGGWRNRPRWPSRRLSLTDGKGSPQ